MLKKTFEPLFIIFVLGFILRITGIDHGLPFIFHPDEPTVVRSALGVRFFKNPAHFDWPHLYIYLNYFLYMLFAKFRDYSQFLNIKDNLMNWLPVLWNDEVIFYLLTRIFSALLGAVTVVPVYLTAKKLFNETAGIFSALTFALLPFHVWHSHYSLPDVPMVFFLSVAIYFTVHILLLKEVRNYILAGLFLGLAASTKYNAGLAVIMIPLAAFIRIRKDNEETIFDFEQVLKLGASALATIAGFLIGTPYALLDNKTFIRTDGPKGALWQFTNVGSVDLSNWMPKFFSDMVYKVSTDVGYTVLAGYFVVLFILIALLLLKKIKTRGVYALFMAITALFLFVYISRFEKSRSHYYLVSYPYIAVVFGYMLTFIFEKIKYKFLALLVIFGLLSVPFFKSVQNAYIYNRPDTRNVFYEWSKNYIKPHDVLIYSDNDIESVVSAGSFNKKRGFDNINEYNRAYIVSTNESYYCAADMYCNVVFSIEAELRRGPDIKVYSYIRN